MKYEIKNRWDGKIIYQDEAESFRALILAAIKAGAYLRSADLAGADNVELSLAQTSIVPDHGPLFGWKKCRNGVLVRLFIPSKARRSNASGRKCRAERAKVLEVIGAEYGVSTHDSTFLYRTGQWVRPTNGWNDNRWEECAGGIHFFLTRIEAESYN